MGNDFVLPAQHASDVALKMVTIKPNAMMKTIAILCAVATNGMVCV